ncbi:draxin [Hemicordylus capensis]|uniref:draxin n=1 Tax=Hemicordylus capensis TaxID=884348 RepID=UPI0023035C71|nr:draxin [Hemicordylus capensis]XP_053136554.1 draxin [Hemicordylus capensis]
MAGGNMAGSPISFSPIFVFCLLAVSPTDSLDPGPEASSLPTVANSFQNQDLWPHRAVTHHRRHSLSKHGRAHHGMPSRARGSGEGTLRLLSRSTLGGEPRLMEPASLRQKDVFLGFEFPYPDQENHAPGSERGKKPNREHRRHSRRDRLKQHRGKASDPGPSALYKKPENFEEQLQALHAEGPSTGLAPTALLGSTPKTSTEEPPALQATASRPRGRARHDGEVMPTLDMTLFDWTDYEDLRADMWPSARRKEKRRSKIGGNETAPAEGEPCDHHLDCLPGCCCDLREHLCKPHNRGLNNKCYDDCMCTEGLRCYAKFHRNRRVTRRKGRCVEPESADGDQGSFINV